jgi:hypothetical protein
MNQMFVSCYDVGDYGLLHYWGVRELGMSTVEMSRRLRISQPTASQSVKRGEKVGAEKKLQLPE